MRALLTFMSVMSIAFASSFAHAEARNEIGLSGASALDLISGLQKISGPAVKVATAKTETVYKAGGSIRCVKAHETRGASVCRIWPGYHSYFGAKRRIYSNEEPAINRGHFVELKGHAARDLTLAMVDQLNDGSSLVRAKEQTIWTATESEESSPQVLSFSFDFDKAAIECVLPATIASASCRIQPMKVPADPLMGTD